MIKSAARQTSRAIFLPVDNSPNPILHGGMKPTILLPLLFSLLAPAFLQAETPANLNRDQLVAWCIVPFDSKNRTPAQRAEMLAKLGIKRCAYDWREQHVAQFEEAILQYKKHGIEYFAFWSEHEAAFALFQKHNLHPQIWKTAPSPAEGAQEQKVEAAAKSMASSAERAAKIGSQLGLYNHGGWGGEPANLVAVCEKLRAMGHQNVGIVYNFHHGHDHIADMADSLKLMKPYLLCLNLNGMNTGAKPKIMPIGKGEHDAALIKVVRESGYTGPVGVIGHLPNDDVEQILLGNVQGLESLLKE